MFASGFGSTRAFIFDLEHKSNLDSKKSKVSWLTCFAGLGPMDCFRRVLSLWPSSTDWFGRKPIHHSICSYFWPSYHILSYHIVSYHIISMCCLFYKSQVPRRNVCRWRVWLDALRWLACALDGHGLVLSCQLVPQRHRWTMLQNTFFSSGWMKPKTFNPLTFAATFQVTVGGSNLYKPGSTGWSSLQFDHWKRLCRSYECLSSSKGARTATWIYPAMNSSHGCSDAFWIAVVPKLAKSRELRLYIKRLILTSI